MLYGICKISQHSVKIDWHDWVERGLLRISFDHTQSRLYRTENDKHVAAAASVKACPDPQTQQPESWQFVFKVRDFCVAACRWNIAWLHCQWCTHQARSVLLIFSHITHQWGPQFSAVHGILRWAAEFVVLLQKWAEPRNLCFSAEFVKFL